MLTPYEKNGQLYVKLNNGLEMPMVGLGTWKSPVGKTGNAVKTAIRAGYRMVDTANDYGNEHEIGEALTELLKAGEVKREDLFIQSKLWNSNHRPEHVREDLVATLKDLQLDYVDNFVLHWPQACPATGKSALLAKHGNEPSHVSKGTMFPIGDDNKYCCDMDSHFTDTWKAMEKLVEEGLCRSIGVSNFNHRQLAEVSACSKTVPATIQNECHPYLHEKDLKDYCDQQGILFQAYSPLGSYDRPWAKPSDPELLKDPRLQKVADKYKKTTAQVVLRWHVERGVSCVPKSVTPSRIEENFGIFDFTLGDDMKVFDELNMGWRHLLWPATAMHPDYPFKDWLPHDHVVPDAPLNTSHSSRS